jgi:hypothetical protein
MFKTIGADMAEVLFDLSPLLGRKRLTIAVKLQIGAAFG